MTGFFSNLSIRFHVILPIAGMMVVSTTFILFFFPSRQRALDERDLENKAMSVSRVISDTAAAGLELDDRALGKPVLIWTKNDQDIVYVVVRDADGQELASDRLEGATPPTVTSIPSEFEVTEIGDVLEVVGPIRRGTAIVGSVQVGLSTATIAASFRRGLWTAFLFNFTVAVLALVTMWLVGRQLAEPIVGLTRAAEQIAADDMKRLADATRSMASGDLTREVRIAPRRIEVVNGGEIGRMASSFNLMLDELGEISEAFNLVSAGLRNIVAHVQAAAEEVATGSDSVADATARAASGNEATVTAVEGITSTLHEMNANIQNVARNAQSQSGSTSETLASIENLLRSVETVAGAAERLVTIANRTSRAVSEGGEAMESAREGMGEIRDVIQRSAEFVQNLGGMADDIGKIVSVIDEVAERSNLLALNAAIEAARAGEHGLGFAIVAEEVRKLAERSAHSTGEIADLVDRIQSQVSRAVDNMEKSTAIVEQGMRRTEELRSNLQNIGQSVKEVSVCSHEIGKATAEQSAGTQQIEHATSRLSELTHEISAATEQQSSGTEQVVESIEQIQVMVQQNADGTSELAASSEELSRQAALMREVASRFKISDNGHPSQGSGANGETGREWARKPQELMDSVDASPMSPRFTRR